MNIPCSECSFCKKDYFDTNPAIISCEKEQSKYVSIIYDKKGHPCWCPIRTKTLKCETIINNCFECPFIYIYPDNADSKISALVSTFESGVEINPSLLCKKESEEKPRHICDRKEIEKEKFPNWCSLKD